MESRYHSNITDDAVAPRSRTASYQGLPIFGKQKLCSLEDDGDFEMAESA